MVLLRKKIVPGWGWGVEAGILVSLSNGQSHSIELGACLF